MKGCLQARTSVDIRQAVPEPFLLFERFQAFGYVPGHFAQPFLIPLPLRWSETTRLANGYMYNMCLREGTSPRVHPRFRCFPRVFPAKRLEVKSLKKQTKAEELGTRCPQFLSFRLSLKAL
jgi:hypothetical protein